MHVFLVTAEEVMEAVEPGFRVNEFLSFKILQFSSPFIEIKRYKTGPPYGKT